MVHTPLLLALLFSWLIPGTNSERPVPASGTAVVVENTAVVAAEELYAELCLENELAQPVFAAGYRKMQKYGVNGKILAIADMTQPSDAKRLYIIDLEKKELVLRTWVAHGQGSGERLCTSFSNQEGSHQTSLGLYKVGAEIISPKHGRALLLHGLERGVNNNALDREVIMHGADYVSASFIASNGRCGRSWGCPAVSKEQMPRMIDLLADGGLLYVYGKR